MVDIKTNFGHVTFTNGTLRLEKRSGVFFIRLVQFKTKIAIAFFGVLAALALMYFHANGFTIESILSFATVIGKIIIFTGVVAMLVGTFVNLNPADRNIITRPNKCEIPIDSISSVTTEKQGIIYKIYINHEIGKNYTVSHVLEFMPEMQSEREKAIELFKERKMEVK
jgi:hypothetical protein